MDAYRVFPDSMKNKSYDQMSKEEQKLMRDYVKIFKYYNEDKAQLIFITFSDHTLSRVLVPAQSFKAKVRRFLYRTFNP